MAPECNVRLGPMTESQYLALEERSDLRHEYVAGYAYALAGWSWQHNDVVLNLLASLLLTARARGCRITPGRIRLRVSSRTYYYPDLMVGCERERGTDIQTERPTLVAEVLSRSTATVDQREKLMAYRQIESLETYLIVHQDEPFVEYHWRDDDGAWQVGEVIGTGECPIRSLGITVSLAALYEGIEFEPSVDNDEDYPAQ